MKTCVFYFLAVGLSAVVGLQLPPDFSKCKRGDPKINKCLKRAIEGALKIMGKGIPEFKLESIQPITVPSMTIGEGNGAVQVVQKYENCKIFNIPLGKIMDVDSIITDTQFELNTTIFLKEAYLLSHYNLNGKILLLPIVGDGDCTITLKNAKVPLELIGGLIEKKGVKYVEIKSLKVHLNAEKVEFDFKNLFNGDPRLGPEMNRILNENWTEIFEDVKYAYGEAFGAIFKTIVNVIFKRVPYDDLFLL